MTAATEFPPILRIVDCNGRSVGHASYDGTYLEHCVERLNTTGDHIGRPYRIVEAGT